MNKIILLLTFIALSASFSTFAQRPLPRTQDKIEFQSDDVVGTWKWFCGSVVTVSPDGNVKAVWDDGRCATARYEKIEDNKYRFIWGNNEWIDILKLRKEGNFLEGTNQCGGKITATKISNTIDKANVQKASSNDSTNTAISGVYTCSEGGTYYVKSDGKNLYWVGESADGGKSWTNIFIGKVEGSKVKGKWYDLPKGRNGGSGDLEVLLAADCMSFNWVEGTGGFGGRQWKRR